MDRRRFLRSGTLLTALGAGGVLTACAGDGGGAAEGGAAEGGAATIPEGDPTLAPQIASFELLTGATRSVPFGLVTLENEPVTGADVEVFLRSLDGEVLAGPVPTRYTEEIADGLGLYVADLPLQQAGQLEFVAVADDGYGTQAVNVVRPEQSQAPVPGQEATVVATPTMARPMGVTAVCTQQPACGMHEISLDEALEAGRPTMLLFATPAYCQTVVCGPAVGTVDAVRNGGDWGETVWIHAEIYADEPPQPFTKAVAAWQLPTEPWLFSIDSSGAIAERVDGPMLPDTITAMAQALRA